MFNKFHKLIAILIALAFFASCSDDSTSPSDEISESKILAEHVESTTDFINSSSHPGVMPASEVVKLVNTNRAYVIDLRSPEDFAKGRINGAVNVALKDLITHVESMNNPAQYDKIVLACYSSQNAIFGGGLLRMMGYDNVISLAFGMAAWHEDFGAGSWPDKISNKYSTKAITAASPPKNAMGELPLISTGKTTGEEILNVRAKEVLAGGFSPASAISADMVFSNPDDYYIIAYWPESHYLDPGHIPGAIHYQPKESLKFDADLKTLPTDKPIVLYCYTGAGSAVIAAYLRMLGYDAKSLLYGANSMWYDKMAGREGFTVWSENRVMNYDYEK